MGYGCDIFLLYLVVYILIYYFKWIYLELYCSMVNFGLIVCYVCCVCFFNGFVMDFVKILVILFFIGFGK